MGGSSSNYDSYEKRNIKNEGTNNNMPNNAVKPTNPPKGSKPDKKE